MSIWDEIDERLEAAKRYDAWRSGKPWRWMPGWLRLRFFARRINAAKS